MAKYLCCKLLILKDLFGGEGGIRTHVPVTRQHAFEARPLRPLRYLSVRSVALKQTFHYSGGPAVAFGAPGTPDATNHI